MKCNVDLPDGRCEGVLQLQQTLAGIAEYECPLCGVESARPVSSPEPEATAPEPWWNR